MSTSRLYLSSYRNGLRASCAYIIHERHIINRARIYARSRRTCNSPAKRAIVSFIRRKDSFARYVDRYDIAIASLRLSFYQCLRCRERGRTAQIVRERRPRSAASREMRVDRSSKNRRNPTRRVGIYVDKGNPTDLNRYDFDTEIRSLRDLTAFSFVRRLFPFLPADTRLSPKYLSRVRLMSS